MAISEEENEFRKVLTGALEKCGLPAHPKNILGKKFMFAENKESDQFIICGVVTGISYSEEGGIHLEVSNTILGGTPIRHFLFSKDKWFACIDIPKPEYAFKGIEYINQVLAEYEHERFVEGIFSFI